MASRNQGKSSKNLKAPKNPVKGAAILKGAASIFAKKGFHEATISEIARKSKVSEATIYEYFSSKEELLFSIPAQTTRQHEEKNREIKVGRNISETAAFQIYFPGRTHFG